MRIKSRKLAEKTHLSKVGSKKIGIVQNRRDGREFFFAALSENHAFGGMANGWSATRPRCGARGMVPAGAPLSCRSGNGVKRRVVDYEWGGVASNFCGWFGRS